MPPPRPASVAAAFDLALRAHGEQRYGDQPYQAHLEAVDGILCEYGHTDDTTRQAAYLHDVLEDTATTPDEIRRVAVDGDRLLAIVAFCSDEPGPDRATRKLATYARIRRQIVTWLASGARELATQAVRVKLADRIANMRACLENHPTKLAMYRSEGASFRAALRIEDADAGMWAEHERLLHGQ